MQNRLELLFFLKPLAEFFCLVFVVHRLFAFFQRNRSGWMFFLLALLAVFYLTETPSLFAVQGRSASLYRDFLLGAGLLLAFAPELQGTISKYQRKLPENKFLEKNGPLDEIVKACRGLAAGKMGALMALRRKDDLLPFIEKSVVIDARIRHELLLTIFMPPAYLHDGGVILSYDRIVSCSAIFPLTQSASFKKKLGTRHRAAIGMSEVTDALCIVVSEETGTISLADRGKLFYGIAPDELRPAIEQALRFKKIRHSSTPHG